MTVVWILVLLLTTWLLADSITRVFWTDEEEK
jgi:hypothetical protein